jgi:acyl carrier protein
VEIVFALEDRYGVRFDEAEFAMLDSTAAIARRLREHLGA